MINWGSDSKIYRSQVGILLSPYFAKQKGSVEVCTKACDR